jgi:hypothetical protein
VISLSDSDRARLGQLGVVAGADGLRSAVTGAPVADGVAVALLKLSPDYGGFGEVMASPPAMPVDGPRSLGVPGAAGGAYAMPAPPSSGQYAAPSDFGFPDPVRITCPGDLADMAELVKAGRHDMRHPDTGRFVPAEAEHVDQDADANWRESTGDPSFVPRDMGMLGDAGVLPGESRARPVALTGPGQFDRPYITEGHQAESATGPIVNGSAMPGGPMFDGLPDGADGPVLRVVSAEQRAAAQRQMLMPAVHAAEPEDFRRGPLVDGQEADPPASDAGGNNPYAPTAAAGELFATAAERLAVNHQTARRDHFIEAVVPHHPPVPDQASPPGGMRAFRVAPELVRGVTRLAPGESW